MSDKVKKTETSNNISEMKEEYQRLLDESFQKTSEINKGDVVEGTIVSITDNSILINLGGKYDAFADVNEFSDGGKVEFKIGDILKGFIVDKNEQGFVIGKSLTKQYVDKQSIKDAFDRQIPVQGKVYSITKGGFNVDILGARAFCPMSQIAVRLSEDNTTFIGKTMDFLVIECSENCRKLVVSHRILEEQVYNERKAKAMEKIVVGGTITGKVMRFTNFGAFVDLDGVEGLLHVSEISWQHIVKPQDVLAAGQDIEMKVLAIKGEKISLSLKALLDNPFDLAIKDIKEGDVINCRVVRLHNFGAFAEIKPGVEGLIPVSEMSRGRMIGHPREILKEGDYVEVQVLRIDSENQKLSLSLKALQSDPWDEIETKIQVGQKFEGIVESSTNFGVFVTIESGITGLLPRSRIRKKEDYKTGDPVELLISAIDKEQHRITLDYTDRGADEPIEEFKRDHTPREPRKNDDRKPGRGRTSRSDEEWRKYANQNKPVSDDNPFKDL